MPVSLVRVEEHIRAHCERLRNLAAVHDWPKYVIHTAQAETAAAILRSGYLLPRSHQVQVLHDVANPGAIAANPAALKFAPLYFRPKTDFHFKTEGIKFKSDPYRDKYHMSIPVMLAFDARSVLTLEGTGFSSGKLAKVFAEPHFDEEYFRAIAFKDVYHDGPTGSRGEAIRDSRMSEIVYPGPLPTTPHLKYAICRTRYDRITLLHLLGHDASRFRAIITTEQTPGSAFIHKALYIKNLVFEQDRLTIEFNRSFWHPAGDVFSLKIEQYLDGKLVVAKEADWPIQYQRRTSKGHAPEPRSIWRIEVEGVTAFHGRLPAGRSGVF